MTEDRREIAEYGNAEGAGNGAAGAGRESSAAITMLRIAADTDKIPYCYEYGEGENVRYLGSDVKLMDYLADTLSAEYEIVPLDGLKHGSDLMADFDVLISGMSPYDFMNWGSDLVWSDPYSIGEKTVPYAAITMKALEAKYRYPEALDGSETGYYQGTVPEEALAGEMPLVKWTATENVLFPASMFTPEVSVIPVRAGREILGSLQKEYVILPFRLMLPEPSLMAAVPSGKKELLEAVNRVFETVRKEGLYERWREEAVREIRELIAPE